MAALAALFLSGIAYAGLAMAYGSFPLTLSRGDAQTGDPAPGAQADPGAPVVFTHPRHRYSVEVPSDWTATCLDDKLCRFSRPSRGVSTSPPTATMNLFVEARPAGGRSSFDLARAYDRQLAADDRGFPDYRRLHLSWIVLGEYKGSLLEFVYTNRISGHRHVIVFRTVSRGTSYEVSLNGPASQFAESRPIFDSATASLRIPE
jgi:hypothetical protein